MVNMRDSVPRRDSARERGRDVAGQTSAEKARADMRELVEAARGRGAGRLFVWGGVAVAAFTAAFASWQYAPVRGPMADTALATASIPPVITGGASTAPSARQVGGRAITTVPGASDMTLLQRDVADLRQDLADLRRGLTRYDVANEQMGRRMEALEEQAAILASRMAQALDGAKPPPPGLPAATGGARPGVAPAASASVAPTPQAKPEMQKLEPALFDPRLGKMPPRPLTPVGDGKAAESKAADDRPGTNGSEKDAGAKAQPVKEAKVAPAEPVEVEPAKPAPKEPAKDAKATEATQKPAEPVVVTAPMPVPPAPGPVTPGPMTPPPSVPPIAATVRPPPTPAEEAQRAQRAMQAAQVQQLAQQMILQQPGGKGLQLPLPTQSQLAAAAAAAKADAKAETTGSVPAPGAGEGAVARTSFAVDLGGYKSLSALKKGWTATAAKHAGLTKSLTPLGQMKEAGNAVEARLIAGPFANAADAVKFCAQVQATGTACAPSVYVGQPLSP